MEVTFGRMFAKRRAAKSRAHDDLQPTDLTDDPSVDENCAEDTPRQDGLTLSTMCACGHVRKDHRGLRMDVCGGCWDCECDEFRPVKEPLERVRALLARVERLQESAAGLRSRVNTNGTGGERPTEERADG